jgi:hypothetical protein
MVMFSIPYRLGLRRNTQLGAVFRSALSSFALVPLGLRAFAFWSFVVRCSFAFAPLRFIHHTSCG